MIPQKLARREWRPIRSNLGEVDHVLELGTN
jgi:hypothetical protein